MNVIGDLKESWSERVKNPFILSFVLSWLINNWKLVYYIFQFDQTFTVYEKVDRILAEIGSSKSDYRLLTKPLLYAFIAIASYLLANGIARAMVLFFRNRVKPIIDKSFGGISAIVSKDSYEDLLQENVVLQNNLKKKDEDYSKHQTDLPKEKKTVDELKKVLNDKENQLQNEKTDKETLRLKYQISEDALQAVKSQLDQCSEKIAENEAIYHRDLKNTKDEAVLANRVKRPFDLFRNDIWYMYLDGDPLPRKVIFSDETWIENDVTYRLLDFVVHPDNTITLNRGTGNGFVGITLYYLNKNHLFGKTDANSFFELINFVLVR